MIEPDNKNISLNRQCKLLGLARSNYYYEHVNKTISESEYKNALLLAFMKHPYYGYRRMNQYLLSINISSTEKKARNNMKKLGLEAIYPKPNLSKRNTKHQVYPYLLNDINIEYVNHVWSTDITYIRLNGAFVYLSAIIDIYSRKVLSWKLSNTMDNSLCIETLNEAIRQYGKPTIFNTDQGSQYTSKEFTETLLSHNILISMDGKGRALDNVYIERLWRSIKYENIYLNEYSSMKELKEGIGKYFMFYNKERFHQSLNYSTPDDIFKAFKKAGSF